MFSLHRTRPRVRVLHGRTRSHAFAHRVSATGALAVTLLMLLMPRGAAAQTDFLNTDGGRPLRVQDALSVEWRALEFQFAPVRIERHRANRWQASLEPEFAFGVLPRTHVSVGLPIASQPRTVQAPPVVQGAFARAAYTTVPVVPRASAFDPGDEPGSGTVSAGQVNGLAGVHLSVFHQLNVETRIPALAVRGEVLLPAGPFAADRAYPSLTGIITRTLPALGAVRMHGNATMTFGAAPDAAAPAGPVAEEVPRWLAGVSMDRAFPLQSTLVAVEAVARQGMLDGDAVVWSAGAGVRHQFSPRLVLDMGVSRLLNGPDTHWSFTVGSAVALGLGRRLF